MTTEFGAPISGAVMKELLASGLPGETLVRWRGRVLKARAWAFDNNGYHLPADNPYYRALSQGPDWWPWFATDDSREGPADYDGEVMFREGSVSPEENVTAWPWWNSDVAIIAYKRKPKASEPVAPDWTLPRLDYLNVETGERTDAGRATALDSEYWMEKETPDGWRFFKPDGTHNCGKSDWRVVSPLPETADEKPEAPALPEWAWERAAEKATAETAGMYKFTATEGPNPALKALARYIAAHEEPTVDPLVKEADKMASEHHVWSDEEDYKAAKTLALAALRRGMELAQTGERSK